MQIFNLKNRKIFLNVLVVFITAVFLLSPAALNAANDSTTSKLNDAITGSGLFAGLTMNTILKGVNVLLEAMMMVVASIMILMGKILSLIISVTLDPRFYTEGIVGTGFKISLQVADTFFLLIMIIIGLATILQYESYSIKKLLPKIIIIALLINFSLPISQFIIGFSDDMAVFVFKQGFQGNMESISDGIINTISPASFVSDTQTTKINCPAIIAASTVAGALVGGGVGGVIVMPVAALSCYGAKAVQAASPDETIRQLQIMSSATLALIVFILLLIYLALGVILFLIRTAMLWTLIILAPLAWIAGALPFASHYLDEWWKKFLSWSFFSFLYALFIYISLSIVTNQFLQDTLKTFPSIKNPPDLSSAFISAATQNIGSVLMVLTIFVLLFGGMFLSLKLAGGAGETIISGAKKATDWATKATSKALKQKVGAPVMGKAGEVAARIPGLKMAGRGMLAKAGKWRSEQIADYEAAAKDVAGLQTQSQKDAYINSFAVDKSKQAGIVASLAKAGDSRTVENALANNPELESIIKEKADRKSLEAIAKITLKPEYLVDNQDTSKDAKTKLEEATRAMIKSMSQEEIMKISPAKLNNLQKKNPEMVEVASEEIARKINENTASEMMRTNEYAWNKINESIEKSAGSSAPPEASANQAAFEEYLRAYKSKIFQPKTFQLIDNGPAESKKQEVKIIVPSASFEKSPEEKKGFQEMQAQFRAEQKNR
jgi:hypothetical protein